jgi:hypothetical protein
MTAHVQQGGASQNLRLKGTATSETLTLYTQQSAAAGGTTAAGGVGVGAAEASVGPIINYVIDGWQTAAPTGANATLSLGGGGSTTSPGA